MAGQYEMSAYCHPDVNFGIGDIVYMSDWRVCSRGKYTALCNFYCAWYHDLGYRTDLK